MKTKKEFVHDPKNCFGVEDGCSYCINELRKEKIKQYGEGVHTKKYVEPTFPEIVEGSLSDAGHLTQEEIEKVVRAVNSHEELTAFINACLDCKSETELLDFVQNNAEKLLAKSEGK